MELLGIALSLPAAFIASLMYCLIIAKVIRRFDRVSRVLWWLSGGVLTWFVLEVLLLLTLGAVRARTMMGPGFYRAHLAVFFLGTPALANVLLLRRRRTLRWYIAVPICTMFAFVLVLLQYGVSGAFYGIDGEGGPFSQGSQSTLQRTIQARQHSPFKRTIMEQRIEEGVKWTTSDLLSNGTVPFCPARRLMSVFLTAGKIRCTW